MLGGLRLIRQRIFALHKNELTRSRHELQLKSQLKKKKANNCQKYAARD